MNMKSKNPFLVIAILLSMSISYGQNFRGNPIVTDIFTADPCPMVHDDTLYIFTGQDENKGSNEVFIMNKWQVYSTADMFTYKHEGSPLQFSDFSWAGCCAFASHTIERNGKFYWYISAKHNDPKTYAPGGEGFCIGVAVADHPTGPYTDAIGAPIFYDSTANTVALDIDPAVFIDDDGQAYLYWGSWSVCRMVRLKDNMIEMEGEIETVEASNFFEAPFIHKYKDLYYLSYASHGYPSKTAYSVSKSITGPWTYKGVINDLIPNSGTNHQGIVEFKDNWYFVYHDVALSDFTWRRSVCVDSLKYDNEGNILKVKRTTTSVAQIGSTSTSSINPEDNIKVYPVPSSNGEFNIDLSPFKESLSAVAITVYTNQGKMVLQQEVTNFNEQYNIKLEPGTYILSATNNLTQHKQKIIVLI